MNYQTMWLILISQSMLLGDGVAQPCYVVMQAKVGQTLLNHQMCVLMPKTVNLL